MADIDIREQMKKDLDECPEWIIRKSIEVIQENLPEGLLSEIKDRMNAIGNGWWIPYHFYSGRSVRNLLRRKVCLDDLLPSGNWDDYYIQMIELSIEDE